jgi:hypothetical protein
MDTVDSMDTLRNLNEKKQKMCPLLPFVTGHRWTVLVVSTIPTANEPKVCLLFFFFVLA